MYHQMDCHSVTQAETPPEELSVPATAAALPVALAERQPAEAAVHTAASKVALAG